LKLFDKTVWFWSRLDKLIPWPGLSLIAVARKKAAGSEAGAAAGQRSLDASQAPV